MVKDMVLGVEEDEILRFDVRRSQKLEMVKELNREKATLELREWRLENRKAFANIWSDMVSGISLFLLLYANHGYKIINNISDTGKAFLIILITTDIFLGYHSESGWETLLEIIMEHYGLELFKFLPRVSNIFQEMKRH
ncbi:hypothetical protein N665_1415s0003 [Sinapis alba]|nr:hypothetical protein N665_1415s0003 [Sinapis alba]